MINERIVIEEKTKDYNEAWIETYFWQESEELYPGQKRPVIVICPVGAYGMKKTGCADLSWRRLSDDF